MSGENEEAGLTARVQQLADAGDVTGLCRSFHHLCADIDGDRGFDGGQLIGPLRAMPASTRVLLLRRMTDGLEETAVHDPGRCRGLASLIVLLAHGLSAEQLAAWREPLMAEAAGEMTLWEGRRLTCLVEVEQPAGRTARSGGRHRPQDRVDLRDARWIACPRVEDPSSRRNDNGF